MNADERAREEWKKRTDGFERVQRTLERTREPASAREIARAALVSEKTARKHLDRLTDLDVATTTQDGRATRYKRDTDAFLAKQVRDLRAEHSKANLIAGIERMCAEIEELRATHGVDSSAELALALEPDDAEEAWLSLSDWRTTERNLTLAQAALSFERAAEQVEA